MFEYIIRVIPDGLRESNNEIGGVWAASAFEQKELVVRKKCRNGEPVEWEITGAAGEEITIGFYERDLPPWLAAMVRGFSNLLAYAPSTTLRDERIGLALQLGAAGWRKYTNGAGAEDNLGGYLAVTLPPMIHQGDDHWEDYGWSAPEGQQRVRMAIRRKPEPEPPDEEDAGDA